MTDQFLGEIRIFGFNFAPIQWATCDGQILPISQNTALFSLIGTYYGGNGTSNFALPDFQGNTGVNQGQGPGLSQYVIGEQTGSGHSDAHPRPTAHSHLTRSIPRTPATARSLCMGRPARRTSPAQIPIISIILKRRLRRRPSIPSPSVPPALVRLCRTKTGSPIWCCCSASRFPAYTRRGTERSSWRRPNKRRRHSGCRRLCCRRALRCGRRPRPTPIS